MYIKLKNKSEIYVSSSYMLYATLTCKWCGRTIKANKTYFFGGGVDPACSVAHVKAALNAAL
jgi:hypothetical protein